jgi:hypothetical protein
LGDSSHRALRSIAGKIDASGARVKRRGQEEGKGTTLTNCIALSVLDKETEHLLRIRQIIPSSGVMIGLTREKHEEINDKEGILIFPLFDN